MNKFQDYLTVALDQNGARCFYYIGHDSLTPQKFEESWCILWIIFRNYPDFSYLCNKYQCTGNQSAKHILIGHLVICGAVFVF